LEIAMSDYDKYEIHTFKNARDALKKLDDTFELVISDINMPGLDGIEFVKTLGGKYEVIIITGNATLTRAIESIQLGVKDFLLKPFEIETLVTAIERTAAVAKKSQKTLSQEPARGENFLGSSPALDQLLARIAKAAVTDASMMLLGESGVGKELFASHIHESSSRSSKPFIAINMAAIPDNLIESELFGFEKGAFTDATEAKTGQFELAEGGTLFLDEIAEMPYSLQAKLLRVLQEREIRRLGGSKNTKIDVRIICATNADLHTKITEGKFREDLYYRLNTIPLNIPPLRERREEILSIAEAALERYCTQYSYETKAFTTSARNALMNYNWPGNIRELISVVERSAILSDGEVIDTEDLFLEARGLGRI
ncbi:MAG: sigma-54 dependent transcriptional regulator, partial [Sulfuricurvum sp.]|uniref:sigma-54-dependent transcriptional regulator n=1 Tax=Sulfuricurvum sp. TaxID=2025608 RepID=UPI0027349ED2